MFKLTLQHLRCLPVITLTLLTGMSMVTPIWAQSGTQGKPPVVPLSQQRSTSTSSVTVLGNAIPAAFSSMDWSALTPEQKNALQPLSATWKNISNVQKRKWISLSTNYSQMTLADQTKAHARMAQWAALSPRQREQARLNFAEVKKVMPSQEKNEKWIAYQALSTEEKKKLAKSAQSKPPHTALAAQPSAPDKLSRLPVKKIAKPPVVPASAVLPNPPLPASPASAAASSAVAASAVTAPVMPASSAP